MRQRFFGTLLIVLATAEFSSAQYQSTIQQKPATGPAAADVGKKQPAAELPPLDRPLSPYWPSPNAMEECHAPGMLPAAPCTTSPGDGTEVLWGSIDYLLLWIKKGPEATPLVTTGSTTNLGAGGNSDTRVLFGGSGVDYDTFSGARFTSGFWFGRGSCWGMEGSLFFTDRQPAHFVASSDPTGTPLLARPVINAVTGQETAVLISDPGVASGNVTINASSKLYGWEINFVNSVARERPTRFELLGGFRMVHLDENLSIIQNSTLLPGGTAGFEGTSLFPPGSLSLVDRFDARNDFYGPHVGARGEYNNGQLFLNWFGKLGIGVTHEVTNVTGVTDRLPTGGTASAVVGGLLALSTNSGKTSRDEFAVVPEIGFNLGYQINPLWRVYVGYSFLYWSDVVRPGDQISRIVNPNFVPISQNFGLIGGPALPGPTFHRTDFWAQGVNFGMELRY